MAMYVKNIFSVVRNSANTKEQKKEVNEPVKMRMKEIFNTYKAKKPLEYTNDCFANVFSSCAGLLS
jgi:hypothetical protein